MIIQYIKNWFNKPATVQPSSTAVATFTTLRIRANSRITIDNSPFIIYDQYTISPTPMGELRVIEIYSINIFNADIFFINVADTNNQLFTLRIVEVKGVISTICCLHLIELLTPQSQYEWNVEYNQLSAASYSIPAQSLVYQSEMITPYTNVDLTQLAPANSDVIQCTGREYYRNIPATPQNPAVIEILIVHACDTGMVSKYAGLELNPAGISVI
jgi:hypothetical protein